VKCSLLSLSTYIDGELAADRKAELDAHLVGCARCSAGAATLREEKTRLGQLARVRVAPQSARLMLEQVGITGVLDLPGVARQAAPTAAPPIDQPPWQAAQEKARQNSAALPWTPRRPAPGSPAMDAAPASSAPPEFQPDLPFVGSPAEERPWTSEPAQQSDDQRPAEIAAAATHVDAPPEPPAEVIAHDYPWFQADEPSRGWDMSPGDDVPHREQSATPVAAPVPPPPMPTPAMVPTRVPSTGRSMLVSRIRDAIAVRLTLARHADAVEESAQIVSGAAPPRGRQLPAPAEPMAAIATDATDVELAGIPDAARPAPVRPPAETPVAKAPVAKAPVVKPPVTKAPDTVAPATPPATEDTPPEATPAEPVAWNAFGASSYPRSEADAAPAAPAPARRVSPGRHSRAVARDQVGVGVRMRRALAATGVLLGQGGDAATAGGRAIVTTVRGANPDRRIIAAIAAVAIIFITVLVVGHRATPATTPTARALPATSAPAHAPTAAASAAPPSARAPATGAPKTAVAPPQTVQTFGAGGTGFQVRDLRYGQQSGYLRMVFDMGPVSGSTGSSPKITVAFTNPTTMLVTFDGTAPAGSTGNPPARGVISSVTLVSSSGGNSVYRIVVTRAVTARGLFLSGTSPPLRFVLDLH
jgi:Putative zinc-finger